MKKLFTLFTLLLASLTLIGCTTNNETDNGTVDPEPDTYSIELTSDYQGATLTQNPEGPHEAGEDVTISASWDDDTFTFVRWEEAGETVSDTASFTYTVEDNAILVAVFDEEESPETFTLDASANIEGVTFTMDSDGPYESGVTVTITPDYDTESYNFVEWLEDGTYLSDQEVLDYTIQVDSSLQAVFEEVEDNDPGDTVFSDLIISEYIEGSSYNKAIELYNGTGEAVDLSEYSLETYFNGSDSAGQTVDLSGTLDHMEAYVIYNTASDDPIIDEGDLSDNNVINYNGNDAITLSKNGTVIDIIGEIGVEGPWNAGSDDTKDNTLVRKDTVTAPSSTWDPDEWTSHSTDTFEYLGYHLEVTALYEVTLISDYWNADLSAEPSSSVAGGTEVTITATDATATYDFVEWLDESGSQVTTGSAFDIVINENRTFEAVFNNPEGYTLTLDSNLYRADLTTDPADMPVVAGTDVTVSASDPDTEYTFLRWEDASGAELSTDPTYTYTMGEADTTLNAVFDIKDYADYADMTLDELTDLDLSTEYDSLEGLYGDELRTAMQNLIDDATLQTYGEARDILDETDEDPDNPDNLILFYRRTSVDSTWDNGATWNREHIWPQSLMPDSASNADANIASDLHGLVPAHPDENSSRGNQHYTLDGEGGYEPHDDVKGDASRMLFYMDIMYDELTLVNGAPSGYEMGDLATLLGWHVADSISAYEESRNDIIESYQGNRNPFIDYPHLAYLIHYDHPEVGLN